MRFKVQTSAAELRKMKEFLERGNEAVRSAVNERDAQAAMFAVRYPPREVVVNGKRWMVYRDARGEYYEPVNDEGRGR